MERENTDLKQNEFPLQGAAAGQMLVVAAAVGVSSCFGAPVSGERCVVFIPTVCFG